jgi:hypothetical protein
MKDKFNTILLIILIIIIIFLGWRIGSIKNSSTDAVEALKKSIIMNDSLTKEADGRYAKLVNYYNTENDLKGQLKDSNIELYKVIKKEGEKILSLTNAIVTLQGQISEGIGSVNPTDTNKIDLSLKYPNDKEPFINWIGSVDRTSAYYKGEWTFGKLPLQVVLTEEKRGIWKSRLIGPDWLKVDSMTVNSLPADKYSDLTPRKIQFLIGSGYIKSLNNGNSAIGVGVGVNLYDKHNILLNVNTNQEIGINYYFKFQKFKKNK